jgi:hypothetical protein
MWRWGGQGKTDFLSFIKIHHSVKLFSKVFNDTNFFKIVFFQLKFWIEVWIQDNISVIKEENKALPAAGVFKAVLPGLRILVGALSPLGFSILIFSVCQSCVSFSCCHYLSPIINTNVGVSTVKLVAGLNLQRETFQKILDLWQKENRNNSYY